MTGPEASHLHACVLPSGAAESSEEEEDEEETTEDDDEETAEEVSDASQGSEDSKPCKRAKAAPRVASTAKKPASECRASTSTTAMGVTDVSQPVMLQPVH